MCSNILKFVVFSFLLIYAAVSIYAFATENGSTIDPSGIINNAKAIDISLGISTATALLCLVILLCCCRSNIETALTCYIFYLIFGTSQIIPFFFDCVAFYNKCHSSQCFTSPTLKYGLILFHMGAFILIVLAGITYLLYRKLKN